MIKIKLVKKENIQNKIQINFHKTLKNYLLHLILFKIFLTNKNNLNK
jgi:hypothetical protein